MRLLKRVDINRCSVVASSRGDVVPSATSVEMLRIPDVISLRQGDGTGNRISRH